MDSQKDQLEKFPGKGGWTYALLPEIGPSTKRFPFGWMRVYGPIDEIKLEKYKLMPDGKEQPFLPVKASPRRHPIPIANDHITHSLPTIVDDSYEGTHWRGSFAVYALQQAP